MLSFEGVVGEVFRRAEASRQDQCVEPERVDFLKRLDVSSGDPGRLGEHVARFVLQFLSCEMVDYVVLFDIGGDADCLCTCDIYGQKCQHGFMDFRSVHDPAAGEKNAYFFHHLFL